MHYAEPLLLHHLLLILNMIYSDKIDFSSRLGIIIIIIII